MTRPGPRPRSCCAASGTSRTPGGHRGARGAERLSRGPRARDRRTARLPAHRPARRARWSRSATSPSAGPARRRPSSWSCARCSIWAPPRGLSRGYGRRRAACRSSPTRRRSSRGRGGGRRAVLLAERLPGVPVVVGENRYEAGRVAVGRCGATAIVLDDGFQHRTLAKDLEIVVSRAARRGATGGSSRAARCASRSRGSAAPTWWWSPIPAGQRWPRRPTRPGAAARSRRC